MKAQVNFDSLGGGINAEWIDVPDATTSPYTISAEWNYDADTIIIIFLVSAVRHIFMYDIATNKSWYSQPTLGWHDNGVDNRFAFTSRSLTGSYAAPTTDISVIPIVGKPTGYFT